MFGLIMLLGIAAAAVVGIGILVCCGAVACLGTLRAFTRDSRAIGIAGVTSVIAACVAVPVLQRCVWPAAEVKPDDFFAQWGRFFDISLAISVGVGLSMLFGALVAYVASTMQRVRD